VVGGYDATSAPFHARRVWQWNGAAAEMTKPELAALVRSLGAEVPW
jgi:hypothetical protein